MLFSPPILSFPATPPLKYPSPSISHGSASSISVSPPYSLHLTLSRSCFALVLSSGCVESRIAAVLHECVSVCVCVGLREDCCWYEKHADYRSAHKCFTLQHHGIIASGFKSRLQYLSIHLSHSPSTVRPFVLSSPGRFEITRVLL